MNWTSTETLTQTVPQTYFAPSISRGPFEIPKSRAGTLKRFFITPEEHRRLCIHDGYFILGFAAGTDFNKTLIRHLLTVRNDWSRK